MRSRGSDRRVRWRWLLGFPVVALLCSLALAGPAIAAQPLGKFYDPELNDGSSCTGAQGTDGGPYGTATRVGSTNTFEIRVWRLSPNTSYQVLLLTSSFGGCGTVNDVAPAILTTNKGGAASGSVSFFALPSTGVFEIIRPPGTTVARTPLITF